VSAAISLIVLVAFGARLFIAARALQRAWIAATLILIGVGLYAIPFFMGFRMAGPVDVVSERIGEAPFAILVDALMIALGFFVPVLLQRTENPQSRGRYVLFFVGVLLSLFTFDLMLAARQISPTMPEIFFAVGVGAFLVVRLRFFEDD
jgi:hypothetical protein